MLSIIILKKNGPTITLILESFFIVILIIKVANKITFLLASFSRVLLLND